MFCSELTREYCLQFTQQKVNMLMSVTKAAVVGVSMDDEWYIELAKI